MAIPGAKIKGKSLSAKLSKDAPVEQMRMPDVDTSQTFANRLEFQDGKRKYDYYTLVA